MRKLLDGKTIDSRIVGKKIAFRRGLSMAKQRYISTSIWDDDWFVEDLNRDEKLFYMYLLTNEHTNIAGIYKVSLRRLTQESGFTKEEIHHLFDRFSADGKAYYKHEYVIMANWPKHQKWQRSTQINKGIRAILLYDTPKEVIDTILQENIPYAYPIDTLSKGIDYLPIGYEYPTHYYDSYSNSDLDSDSNSRGCGNCGNVDNSAIQERIATNNTYNIRLKEADLQKIANRLASKGLSLDYIDWIFAKMKSYGNEIRAPDRYFLNMVLKKDELIQDWEREKPVSTNSKAIKAPAKCPECGGETKTSGDEYMCITCHRLWNFRDGRWVLDDTSVPGG
jgi:hypothetical protein